MKIVINKLRKIVTALSVMICILIITMQSGAAEVRAVAVRDLTAAYESSNVMENLQDSVIAGKAFDIADYPHNTNGRPQVISFVEFCYSYYAEKQTDYGLYLYVYNPQDRAFDTDTDRNKIEMKCGSGGYAKYTLEFLNYSDTAGYEGRFYKFRVGLTLTQSNAVLDALDENAREYEVVGIELSYKNEVTDYACGQKYTYTGYVLGYGSELAESDTLSCTVDGFDKYLTLDVRSTYYRPQGTYDDGYTQDTLHSVYFSVPNEVIEEYGEMTAVHATWLNAMTAPIFVTGNRTVYNALSGYVGKEVDGGTIEDYESDLEYSLIATKALADVRDTVNAAGAGYYVYNAYSNFSINGELENPLYDNVINYLRYLFYAEGGDADNYTLSREKIINWFESYTEKHGGELVTDRYSRELFTEIDGEFTDVTISSDETYSLTDNTVSDNIWNRLFGHTVTDRNSYTMSAIQKVTVKDINDYSDKSLFCDKFYISENDYKEFTSYTQAAAGKNETVYLFRYYQSDYVSHEVTEYKRTTYFYLIGGTKGYYEVIDTNAYFAQMSVQLDFDIIDLRFTKNGVETVIPVVSSPQDIIADATPPATTVPDPNNNTKLIFWLIVAVMLVVTLLIIIRLFPIGSSRKAKKQQAQAEASAAPPETPKPSTKNDA